MVNPTPKNPFPLISFDKEGRTSDFVMNMSRNNKKFEAKSVLEQFALKSV
jgi:hypothetical protein